ncbi:MAG: 7-cyano-7-deazaguanine synthase QueC [Planctomycetes bacterium]|nr:7-cyano-7-deazaguanine synthase QueC [Planctomycetota bacterium]
MDIDNDAALVVLSGGQDSCTCLAWAKKKFKRVETITFDYGQRHRVELASAEKVAALADVPYYCLPIDAFAQIGGNSLTGDVAVEDGVCDADHLPNTFVPGRNIIFMSFAAAYAYTRGIVHLVTGVCQTDYSGYPDCRQVTMDAMQETLRHGIDAPFEIHTPLMYLSKSDSIRMAEENGAMELLAWSHTCYNGEVPPCGHCPACVLRAKGFADAGVADPLVQRCESE